MKRAHEGTHRFQIPDSRFQITGSGLDGNRLHTATLCQPTQPPTSTPTPAAKSFTTGLYQSRMIFRPPSRFQIPDSRFQIPDYGFWASPQGCIRVVFSSVSFRASRYTARSVSNCGCRGSPSHNSQTGGQLARKSRVLCVSGVFVMRLGPALIVAVVRGCRENWRWG